MRQLRYCGACGSDKLKFDTLKEYRCDQCGWIYFCNPAAAAIGLLWYEDELLLVRRGCEPAKGMLDLPGGFVDPGESAEQALRRELQEELNLTLSDFQYVGSFPNHYLFGTINYSVVDLIFEATLPERPTWHNQEELSEIVWCTLRDLDIEQMAFPSIRQCLRTMT